MKEDFIFMIGMSTAAISAALVIKWINDKRWKKN